MTNLFGIMASEGRIFVSLLDIKEGSMNIRNHFFSIAFPHSVLYYHFFHIKVLCHPHWLHIWSQCVESIFFDFHNQFISLLALILRNFFSRRDLSIFFILEANDKRWMTATRISHGFRMTKSNWRIGLNRCRHFKCSFASFWTSFYLNSFMVEKKHDFSLFLPTHRDLNS